MARLFYVSAGLVSAARNPRLDNCPQARCLPCGLIHTGSLEDAQQEEMAAWREARQLGRQLLVGIDRGHPEPQKAERALKRQGANCYLLAEWGRSYVWCTIFRSQEADLVRRELAVRLLITLADENVFPVGDEGRPAVLMDVAQFFALERDPVTALAAANRAWYLLNKGEITGSEDAASFRKRLQHLRLRLTKRVAKLKKGLRGE